MAKTKQDYAAKFARLARKHNISFFVRGNGDVEWGYLNVNGDWRDLYAPSSTIFGTKAAYDWLKQTIKEEQKGR